MPGPRPDPGNLPRRLDMEAFRELEEASRTRVKIIRTRAEKWLGAITAITGLVTTVLVFKVPDTIGKLADEAQIVAALLLGIAFFCLVSAILDAYAAAFGDVFSSESMLVNGIRGLHEALQNARVLEEADSLAKLRKAIVNGVAGTVLVAAAVLVSWFGLAESSGGGTTCLSDGSGVVAVVPASSINLTKLADGYAVAPCPEE